MLSTLKIDIHEKKHDMLEVLSGDMYLCRK